jgi:hypothetical protein
VQRPGDGDDVLLIIAISKVGAQEHSPDMHVERDVASFHISDWNSEVPCEDLDSHGGLLLTDPNEVVETPLKLVGRRLIRPDSTGVTAITGDHAQSR